MKERKKFYEKHLNDNKQFEVAVRRLFEICQITDLYGRKMLGKGVERVCSNGKMNSLGDKSV